MEEKNSGWKHQTGYPLPGNDLGEDLSECQTSRCYIYIPEAVQLQDQGELSCISGSSESKGRWFKFGIPEHETSARNAACRI